MHGGSRRGRRRAIRAEASHQLTGYRAPSRSTLARLAASPQRDGPLCELDDATAAGDGPIGAESWRGLPNVRTGAGAHDKVNGLANGFSYHD